MAMLYDNPLYEVAKNAGQLLFPQKDVRGEALARKELASIGAAEQLARQRGAGAALSEQELLEAQAQAAANEAMYNDPALQRVLLEGAGLNLREREELPFESVLKSAPIGTGTDRAAAIAQGFLGGDSPQNVSKSYNQLRNNPLEQAALAALEEQRLASAGASDATAALRGAETITENDLRRGRVGKGLSDADKAASDADYAGSRAAIENMTAEQKAQTIERLNTILGDAGAVGVLEDRLGIPRDNPLFRQAVTEIVLNEKVSENQNKKQMKIPQKIIDEAFTLADSQFKDGFFGGYSDSVQKGMRNMIASNMQQAYEQNPAVDARALFDASSNVVIYDDGNEVGAVNLASPQTKVGGVYIPEDVLQSLNNPDFRNVYGSSLLKGLGYNDEEIQKIANHFKG